MHSKSHVFFSNLKYRRDVVVAYVLKRIIDLAVKMLPIGHEAGYACYTSTHRKNNPKR
jgi:hypothetical protein